MDHGNSSRLTSLRTLPRWIAALVVLVLLVDAASVMSFPYRLTLLEWLGYEVASRCGNRSATWEMYWHYSGGLDDKQAAAPYLAKLASMGDISALIATAEDAVSRGDAVSARNLIDPLYERFARDDGISEAQGGRICSTYKKILAGPVVDPESRDFFLGTACNQFPGFTLDAIEYLQRDGPYPCALQAALRRHLQQVPNGSVLHSELAKALVDGKCVDEEMVPPAH